MKKWFEFQDKFHKSKCLKNKEIDYLNFENFIHFNIEKEKIKPILDIAKVMLKKNELNESLCIESGRYIEFLKTCYKNLLEINEDELKKWIDDPEYSRLMIESGKRFILYVNKKGIFYNKILQSVENYFNINWDKADIKLYAQLPGQMFPLHYDAFKSNIFTDSHNNEHKIKTWLIMLEDQKPGQCFLMGKQYISWKQGDVISWKNVEVPHGSGNFGYWPRFTMRISGEVIG